MRLGWICVLALAACSKGPALSVDQAETIIDDVGRGAAAINICSESGRATFRAAVRTYSAARADEGATWPDFFGSWGSDREMEGGELAVMGGLIAGYVRADDLSGQAQEAARMINLSMNLNDQRRMFRDGMRDACPEVMELQQLMARQQVEAERVERRAQRLEDRGDTQRAYDMRQRYFNRAQQARERMQSLMNAISAKISAAQA